jgi:hypothetical protein
VERNDSDGIGTWVAATTLLAGVVASSLPAGPARALGTVQLIGVGLGLVAVGLVNLRAALALDGRDLGPTILSTLLPAAAGGLLVALGTVGPAAELTARSLGVVTAIVGLGLLVPPPQTVAIVFSRASGRRRFRRSAVR